MENNFIPNSTQVPNIILDMIIPRISEADGRCLLYICRRTYGFHRERDRISLSQFVDGIINKENKRLDYGTGLSRPAVVDAIKNLVESEVIKVIKTTGGNYYEMNIDLITDNGDEVVNKVNQLRKLTRSGKLSKPKQVNLLNPQKKGKKEKESISDSRIANLIKYFIEDCKSFRSFEPEISYAKEGRLLKQKLVNYSEDDLKDLIHSFVISKVANQLGCSLSICLSSHYINLWKMNKGTNNNPIYKKFKAPEMSLEQRKLNLQKLTEMKQSLNWKL